jgi:hypothetical protein
VKEENACFFEKKPQKTFALFAAAPGIKVFLLLFLQKKKILASFLVLLSATAHAAAPTVVVADFDFEDTSGEARDQTALHDARLKAFKADIIAKLGAGSAFTVQALQCHQPSCSAGSLDQDSMEAAARAQHAQYVVFGGVQKISTLIQFGQVRVMDVASGRSVLSRAISFRGDDEAAWAHAGDYVSQMLVQSLK